MNASYGFAERSFSYLIYETLLNIELGSKYIVRIKHEFEPANTFIFNFPNSTELTRTYEVLQVKKEF